MPRPLPPRRKAPFIAPLLLLAALLLPPPAAAADAAAEAKALVDGGRPVEAIPLLEGALAGAPDDPRLHLLLGVALQRAGRVAEALPAFERAVALAPDSGMARYNLGAAHFALGHWDAAHDAFVGVPERDAGMAAGAWLNAGFSRLKQGRVAEGESLLRRALAADPDGSAAEAARRVLGALAAEPVEVSSRPDEKAPLRRTPSFAFRRVTAAWAVGREFDSNVFALPDDGTVADLSDWRTSLEGEVEGHAMVADRYRVSPQYDFDGYWYDTESAYGYRRHRVSVRVDDRRAALRPRLTAGYVFSQLGNEAYLAGPWLEGRLTLLHKDRSYLWAKFEAALVEAPGERYDALSGHSLQGTLSAYTPAGEGWVYGALTARYLDRGSNATTVNGKAVTLDYSYASVEPLVAASQPLPWGGLTANGSLRYEARRYADPDTWTGGARRRVDHRFTARLAVERPVWKRVDVELSWRGQVRRSNITAADYRDRDYTRNLYGVFLKGDF